MCRYCDLDSETPKHLITSCPAFMELRSQIFGEYVLGEIPKLEANQVIKFIKDPTVWEALEYQTTMNPDDE